MAKQMELLSLPVGSLRVAKGNPRQDVGDVKDLAASIKQIGIIEPIVVVERDGKYEIVAGTRRAAAAKSIGLVDVPVRVMAFDEAQTRAAGLIENLQRKDLNPIEEAAAFALYLALTGEKPAALAKAIGRAPATIERALKLNDVPDPVKTGIIEGWLGAAHGLAMLGLENPADAAEVLKAAQQNNGGRKVDLPTIPLRVLDDFIGRANIRHRRITYLAKLPELLARRKAELEATKPPTTVTWAPSPANVAEAERPWHVQTHLGKPTVAIALSGWQLQQWKTHKKDCGCNAAALVVEPPDWKGENGKIETVDVCINAAAAAKYLRASGHRVAPKNGKPRESKEQAEKRLLTQAIDRIGSDLRQHQSGGGLSPKSRAVIDKLTHRDLGTEVARIVLFGQVHERWMPGREKLALWRAIERMPLDKVKRRIVERAVVDTIPLVPKSGHVQYGMSRKGPEPHIEPLLAKYRFTLADADLLPKLELDAKKPTPAQKRKRAAEAHEKSRATQRAKGHARKAGR